MYVGFELQPEQRGIRRDASTSLISLPLLITTMESWNGRADNIGRLDKNVPLARSQEEHVDSLSLPHHPLLERHGSCVLLAHDE